MTKTLYASETGNDDTGDGTKDRPFATVDAAVVALAGHGTVMIVGKVQCGLHTLPAGVTLKGTRQPI